MTDPKIIRILYVNHTGEISGAERVLLQMLQGLDRQAYLPIVLCPEEGPLRHAVEQLGVEWVVMKPLQARFTAHPGLLLRYLSSTFTAMVHMRRKVKSIGPDLIHANTVRAGIVATAASVGVATPVIWHVHDILPKHPISTCIRMLAYLARQTRILCVSAATAAAFKGRLNFEHRINVLHNGVDLSKFPRKTIAESSFRSELGLARNDFLICAIGQIAPRKRFRELIQAFANILAEAPTSHLAIVGEAIFNKDHEYRDELLVLIDHLKLSARVHITGARNDISMILRSADVFVLNSVQEPFGLVLVEAMSSGTAVVATAVGGIPEIVTDGVTGWLIDPVREGALADRMLYLEKNRHLLDAVQDAAIEITCPRFSLSRFLTNLHLFYRNFAYGQSDVYVGVEVSELP